jgi:hypothetical protein
MGKFLDEFERRRQWLDRADFQQITARITGFLDWLEQQDATKEILRSIRASVNADELMKGRGPGRPLVSSTEEEMVALGLRLMERCREGKELWELSFEYDISTSGSSRVQDYVDDIMQQYISPTIDYVRARVEDQQRTDERPNRIHLPTGNMQSPRFPPEITDSLQEFRSEHPDHDHNAFLMMQFGQTPAHERIASSIKGTLAKHGITALRADDKEYHHDLFTNVLTYIYGCAFGIAVFERLESDVINPNVSLEVGYLMGLRKPVCLLKDSTVKALHTDLVGMLYRTFDPQDPEGTIERELIKWLRDKKMLST